MLIDEFKRQYKPKKRPAMVRYSDHSRALVDGTAVELLHAANRN